MLAPTDQAAQQDSNAERNRKQKERGAERSRRERLLPPVLRNWRS
ncbi:hypothetical protein [Saccharopolyspora spinosa]